MLKKLSLSAVKSYFKILKMALAYKGLAALNILFNVMYVVFNLLSLLVFIPFLQLIFETDAVEVIANPPVWATSNIDDYFSDYYHFWMSNYIGAEGKLGALEFICVSVVILFLLKNICRYLAMFFLAGIRNGVVRDLREALYCKILILPLGFYSDERKGDIIARTTGDVQEVETSIMSSLELIFREPISIVITLGSMIIISPTLTIGSFILLPIGALVIGRVGKSLKRTSTKGQNKMGELISNIEESLGGLRIIKAFTAEDSAQSKFDKLNNAYRRLMVKAYRKRDLASPLSEILGSVVMVCLVYFGGRLILTDDGTGDLSGSAFIAFIAIFSQLLRPIQGVASAYSNINKGAAALERVEEILEAENNITEKENAQEIGTFSDGIEYRGVSFSYSSKKELQDITDGAEEEKISDTPDTLVLKNINLSIQKGKTIALVGESGGGKSTMADLLPRFYDVTEGGIHVDGVDIRDLSLDNLRGLMGIVTQQSILFNDSIFNNIAFGTEATMEEVVNAAKIANAHEFIEGMKNGYQTNIGDGGGKLSGGQRQRVSIARAVLKNPPILILDEATSALDTESERLVQDALYKLMENRTSLVIAHRLSTIQHADEIIVLVKGEIVERGTHAELLERQGVYKKLSDLQSFS